MQLAFSGSNEQSLDSIHKWHWAGLGSTLSMGFGFGNIRNGTSFKYSLCLYLPSLLQKPRHIWILVLLCSSVSVVIHLHPHLLTDNLSNSLHKAFVCSGLSHLYFQASCINYLVSLKLNKIRGMRYQRQELRWFPMPAWFYQPVCGCRCRTRLVRLKIWPCRNNIQWNLKQNTNIFIEEN